MKITEHFTLEEFACHDGTAYPFDWIAERLQPLCEMLEVVRTATGGPIVVNSGYRTLAYDQKLYDADKGAGNVAKPQGSQHPQGRAADIVCPHLTPLELRDLIGQLYVTGKIPALGGMGLYPTFVHVDIRPHDGHLAQWGGTRLTNIA